MQLTALMAGVLLAVVAPRDPTLRVHDLAGLLSAAERESLESLAQSVERQTTAQLAVVTVRSLDGQTVESYAHELFNSWGIGQKRREQRRAAAGRAERTADADRGRLRARAAA